VGVRSSTTRLLVFMLGLQGRKKSLLPIPLLFPRKRTSFLSPDGRSPPAFLRTRGDDETFFFFFFFSFSFFFLVFFFFFLFFFFFFFLGFVSFAFFLFGTKGRRSRFLSRDLDRVERHGLYSPLFFFFFFPCKT